MENPPAIGTYRYDSTHMHRAIIGEIIKNPNRCNNDPKANYLMVIDRIDNQNIQVVTLLCSENYRFDTDDTRHKIELPYIYLKH